MFVIVSLTFQNRNVISVKCHNKNKSSQTLSNVNFVLGEILNFQTKLPKILKREATGRCVEYLFVNEPNTQW